MIAKEYINAAELLEQPNHVLFYEATENDPAIYRKIETFRGDVVVLGFDRDFEQSRLGLPEMDLIIRQNKRYHVYTKEELKTMIDFFTLAYLQSKTSVYNTNIFAS